MTTYARDERGRCFLVGRRRSFSFGTVEPREMDEASTEEQGSLVGFSFSESNDHRLSTPLHFVYRASILV
jgi:hypothetical protein